MDHFKFWIGDEPMGHGYVEDMQLHLYIGNHGIDVRTFYTVYCAMFDKHNSPIVFIAKKNIAKKGCFLSMSNVSHPIRWETVYIEKKGTQSTMYTSSMVGIFPLSEHLRASFEKEFQEYLENGKYEKIIIEPCESSVNYNGFIGGGLYKKTERVFLGVSSLGNSDEAKIIQEKKIVFLDAFTLKEINLIHYNEVYVNRGENEDNVFVIPHANHAFKGVIHNGTIYSYEGGVLKSEVRCEMQRKSNTFVGRKNPLWVYSKFKVDGFVKVLLLLHNNRVLTASKFSLGEPVKRYVSPNVYTKLKKLGVPEVVLSIDTPIADAMNLKKFDIQHGDNIYMFNQPENKQGLFWKSKRVLDYVLTQKVKCEGILYLLLEDKEIRKFRIENYQYKYLKNFLKQIKNFV